MERYESNCEEVKETINEDVQDVQTEKSVSNSVESSPPVDSKLSRDPYNSIIELVKNDLVFKSDNPNEFYKIVSATDREDVNKFQIKAKNDSNSTVLVTIKNFHEFSVYKSIRVVIVNYLSKVFEIFLPFNINSNFEKIRDEFCSLYLLDKETIAVIFREKRFNNKELSAQKLQKDFDFAKDFIMFVQAKTSNQFMRMEETYYTFNYGDKTQSRRNILFFSHTVKVPLLFMARSSYESSGMKYISFQIYEINEPPQKYKMTKPKKNATTEADKYNFDSWMTQKLVDNEKVNLIYSDENINADYHYDQKDDNDPLYFHYKNSFYCYTLPYELTFHQDKIYVFKMEVTSKSTCRLTRFEKGKNTYTQKDVTCNIFGDKKNKEGYIIGIEFRQISLFEK